MSLVARQDLVASQHLVFQSPTQKSDLLNPELTQTYLIAMLIFLTNAKGWFIEITSVRSDHGVDGAGIGYHNPGGWAVDCWPLTSKSPGDYVDAGSLVMQTFLEDVASGPFLLQIGLGGSAWDPENAQAAGPTVFEDDGEDHIHIGCQP